MEDIKVFRIHRIPSFEYKVHIPSGLSRLTDKKCHADISCHGSWVSWEDNDLRVEPEYLTNITNFFSFLNFNEYFPKYTFDTLDALNRSGTAKKFFENLKGIFFKCDKIPQYNAELGLFIHSKDDSNTRAVSLKQTKDTFTEQVWYRYLYQCSGYHNERVEMRLSVIEGKGLITLLRLSLLAMINEYQKTHSSNIRVINGWYVYREDLLGYCKEQGLIWCE